MSIDLKSLPKDDPFRCLAKSMKELDKVQARLTRAGLHDVARSVRDLRDECMGYVERMGREMDL